MNVYIKLIYNLTKISEILSRLKPVKIKLSQNGFRKIYDRTALARAYIIIRVLKFIFDEKLNFNLKLL